MSRKIIYIILIVLLFISLLFLLGSCSRGGYGYPGYHGGYHRHSFFYFGGPRYHYYPAAGSPSVRRGSPNSSRSRGGRRGGK